MKKTLFFILILIFLNGCGIQKTVGDNMIRILGIGDSLTAERKFATDPVTGQPLVVYYEKLATGLSGVLSQYTFGGYTTGESGTASFINHGHGGWATEDYIDAEGYPGALNGFLPVAWSTEAMDENPTIVTIMLGTNDHAIRPYPDASNINPSVSISDYEANLRQMVDDIRTINNGTSLNGGQPIIILMTPPPTKTQTTAGGTKLSNSRIAEYAQVVRNVALEKNTRLIDVYTEMWTASGESEATYISSYSIDGGLHLNQAGQDFIYSLVYDELISILQIIVSTPTITIQGNTLTAQSTAIGTTQPIKYYWGTNGVSFPYAMPSGVYDFIGRTGTVYIRAQVTDGGTFYSSIAPFNLPSNYMVLKQPDLSLLTIPLFPNVQGYPVGGTNRMMKIVELDDPDASVIITKWYDGTIKAIAKS